MRAVAAAAVLALGACCACPGRVDPEGESPEAAARRLFELARQPESERDAAKLAVMFDEESLKRERGGLLEALAALAAAGATGPPLLEATAPDEFLVELDATLPGGGVAHYMVQLRPAADGGFRIHWFAGPGVEWPRPRRTSGDGLTVSAPP